MAAKKKDNQTGKQPALRITCSKAEFWRGGRKWTKEPIVVALSDLDNKQLALITKEPKLTVEHIEIEAKAEAPAED